MEYEIKRTQVKNSTINTLLTKLNSTNQQYTYKYKFLCMNHDLEFSFPDVYLMGKEIKQYIMYIHKMGPYKKRHHKRIGHDTIVIYSTDGVEIQDSHCVPYDKKVFVKRIPFS